jgi:uncharacterized membrane protein YbjE (DUF340 family)
MTIIIFSALILGLLTGRWALSVEAKPILDAVLMNALAVMVFCAGTDIGNSKNIVRKFLTIKTLGLSILVTVITNLGSMGGGILFGMLCGVPVGQSLLVSSGMGWYSLSSVVLSSSVGTELGTLAFIANALRELLTILAVPLLSRYCTLPLVVIGGATSMDSTMPVLLECAGRPVAIMGFVNGFILSLEIPLLFSLLLTPAVRSLLGL